jgi:type IV secretion system protein VirB2
VAFVVSLIGIVVAGCILIFGSDLNAFFRTMLLIVMIISILIAAQNWLAGTFGRGASIAALGQHSQEA